MGLFNLFKKKKFELTEEQLKWNKMWDLWTEEKVESPYAELMTYHSQVNGGGHAYYFDYVQDDGNLEKTIDVLNQILPTKFKTSLKKGYKAFLALEKNSEDEKSEEVLTMCDDVFYENEEEIISILEQYASTIEL